jgi:prolyl-tRNA editing enzyme YbaK/EbsC (Cys-tRNA(Pro) deacylase)
MSSSLSAYLDGRKVAYKMHAHKQVYTAYDLAQTLKMGLDTIAKTVLVGAKMPTEKKKGMVYFAVVLPATHHVDLEKMKKILKADEIEMVTEKAMKKLGFIPGALSPFGSKYGFNVIFDKTLMKSKKIVAAAESFTDAVVVSAKDFVKSEAPMLMAIGKKNSLKLQKVVKDAKKIVKSKAGKKLVKDVKSVAKSVKKDAMKVGKKTKGAVKKLVGAVKKAKKVASKKMKK